MNTAYKASEKSFFLLANEIFIYFLNKTKQIAMMEQKNEFLLLILFRVYPSAPAAIHH